MSTHIPGRHIDGMVKRFKNADAILPPGWTREALQSYQDDPDGARAVCRAIHRDTFTAAIERDAEDWDDDPKVGTSFERRESQTTRLSSAPTSRTAIERDAEDHREDGR